MGQKLPNEKHKEFCGTTCIFELSLFLLTLQFGPLCIVTWLPFPGSINNIEITKPIQDQVLYPIAINNGILRREELNIGTVPTFKMHNVGTVPMFKMHNVETLKIYNLCLELEFGLYGKNK